MAPRRTQRDDGRMEQQDLCASLSEMAAMLPISGVMLTKKEILAHTLFYLNFLWSYIQKLQACLPAHCLSKADDRACRGSDTDESIHSETITEACTPPGLHGARLKNTCGRSHKKPPLSRAGQENKSRDYRLESRDDITKVDEPDIPSVMSECSDHTERLADCQESMQDSDSLPSSLDSGFSLSQPATQTVPLRENSMYRQPSWMVESDCCSVCKDQTGSERGNPSSGLLDTPLSGTQALLLKDQMLWSPSAIGSPLECASPSTLLCVSDTQESLNLSPSLLSSPARDVIDHLVPEGQELLHTVFEDVWVTSTANTAKAPDLPACSLDDPESQRDNEQPHSQDSCMEDEDSTWFPIQWGPLRKMRHSGRMRRSTTNRQPRSHPSSKKKCINGFIMFCRMNRKVYLCSHPGISSTMVTKELANLWHIMPKQERHVYCMKARRFSCQQNRHVRVQGEMEGEEDVLSSPLHTLLTHRNLYTAASELIPGHPHTPYSKQNI